MYKKITHTIVEEHFDHPMAAQIAEGVKSTWKPRLRYYPDGEQIPSDLPLTYQVAPSDNRCGNCLAFDTTNSSCKHWLVPVRTEYVCPHWTAI